MSRRRPTPRPRGRGVPGPPSHGSLRVIAGELRGRRLDAPTGTHTRPTSDRVRQATFNALDSLGVIDGAQVIDAFAGSGALGIEALSRGAAHVTFADTDAGSRGVVESNLVAVGLTDRARVLPADGARLAAELGPWDLVLLDPPYSYDAWDHLLTGLVPRLAPEAVVVVESDREVELPTGLEVVRVRRYGGTVVTFASPTGATP